MIKDCEVCRVDSYMMGLKLKLQSTRVFSGQETFLDPTNNTISLQPIGGVASNLKP